MKRFLLRFLAFSCFCLISYSLLLFVWGLTAPRWLRPNLNYRLGAYGHMYSRVRDVKRTDSVDMLFLGSSHTYRGFDPRIFKASGFSCFNLGSNSQSPIQTELLVKRYQERLNPKFVLYEVFPFTLASDGVESALDIIANDRIDVASLQMALRVNNLKVYNVLLYGYMRQQLGLNYAFEEAAVKGNDLYVTGGYVEKKMQFFKNAKQPKRDLVPNDRQFTAFTRTIDGLKKRGVICILVYAPITKGLYSSISGREKYDSLMSSQGIYLNFNEILNLNDSLHFYDAHHLNQDGVRVFNQTLIETLKSREIL